MTSIENAESKLDHTALGPEYSGILKPETISRIIEAYEVAIDDVAEALGEPGLRAQFAGKAVGFVAIMLSIEKLEANYPKISPYIHGRVHGQLDPDEIL
jgi:hypothetical protein